MSADKDSMEIKAKKANAKAKKAQAKVKETESVQPASISDAVEASVAKLSAQDLASIAEAEAKAATVRLAAAREAADAADEEQYREAAKDLKIEKITDSYTDKRSGDIIFRRELGEPEFWIDKKNRVPSRIILTEVEKQKISKRVEIPADHTPKYNPEYILSKEYGGISNYEIGLDAIKEEAEQKLQSLKNSNANKEQIIHAIENLKKLDHLYENYHIGMNVFRTAKGGRDKIKK